MSEEIIVSVLSRLPPKTLMRFKCVRRSWYSLIISSRFIARHLSNTMYKIHSISIFCKRIILRDINTNEKEAVCSLITFSNDSYTHEHDTRSVVEDIHIPLSLDVTTRGQFGDFEALFVASIVGHCNGIICISFALGSVKNVLWNPAIKELKIIPEVCRPNGSLISMAFGYDPKYEDYKYLTIVDPTAESIGYRVVYNRPIVEIYTLNTGTWREIETYSLETETTLFLPMDYQMYMSGFCYWVGCERQKDFMEYFDRNDEEWVRQVIHTFDMSNEVFDHILLPYSLYDLNARYFDLHVISWKESIALFGMYSYGALFTTDAYGLWVLNNIGNVEGSWTKLFTLEVLPSVQKELAFWKSDEILMLAKDGRIYTHNFEAQKFKYLLVDTLYPASCEAVICVNSIVPVTLESNRLESTYVR